MGPRFGRRLTGRPRGPALPAGAGSCGPLETDIDTHPVDDLVA